MSNQTQITSKFNPNNVIALNAVAVNGSKRAHVTARFNGIGQAIDKHGNVMSAPTLNLQGGTSIKATPTFPESEYKAAIAAGDSYAMQDIANAFQEAVAAAAEENGGTVTEQSARLNAVCEYLEKIEGWSQTDKGPSIPIFSRDDFAMNETPLQNGAVFITIAQSAVYGAR